MDENIYDELLEKIAEIMQFAYDNAHRSIPPEVEKKVEKELADLEQQILQFKMISDKALEGTGINEHVVKMMLEDVEGSGISQEYRELLLKAENLKQEAEKGSKDVVKAALEMQQSGKKIKKSKKSDKNKSPQARKGKFKGMGGYKNWKPL